ncbi:hypothetical protein BW687_003565 [Pseudomonas graminis]|uniref:hypothetical protein n=1 Tax=Pseudomonas graminis TaxID=158627 RepID=UPI00234B0510|nr:hypothetical protein [Pseudomonas graminis]MDC6379255.1 hypothetical protein [Pseudomonas graminis]
MNSKRKPGDQDPEFGDLGVIAIGLDKKLDGHIRHLKEGYLIVGVAADDLNADLRVQSKKRVIAGAAPAGFNYRTALKQGVVTARLDKDGQLVQSYGVNGYAYIPLFEYDLSMTGVLVLPDESVLVAVGIFDLNGGEFDSLALVKIAADGRLDENFGNNGIYRPALLYPHSVIGGMAVQDDDAILITAATIKAPVSESVLMRIDSDGNPDVSFGKDGFVYSPHGAEGGFTRITLDAQRRIYVAGNIGYNMAVFRFLGNGAVDKTFGLAGEFTYGDGNSIAFAANLAARDTAIYVVGALGGVGLQAAVYTKLSLDGELDQGFNGGVPLRVDLGGNAGSYVIPLDTGMIGVGTKFGLEGALTLSRITANGTLDTNFGEEGSVLTEIPGYLSPTFAEEIKGAGGMESKLLIGGGLLNPRPGEETSFWISQYLI